MTAGRRRVISAQPDSALELAQKLVGLAREEEDALKRGANEQFEWIGLRRAEVTAKLSALVAAGTLVSQQEADAIGGLQKELALLDAAMENRVKHAMTQLAVRSRDFDRSRKSVARYLTLGERVPSFVDSRR